MAGMHIDGIVLFLFIGCLQLSGVLGIYCFQCNSLHDPECEIVMPNDTSSVFYRPCQPNDLTHGEELFCRKIVQTIYDRDNMVRVIRSCGWVQHKRDCYVITNKGHEEIACQCFSDGCNSATKNSFMSFAVIAPIFLLMSYTRL